ARQELLHLADVLPSSTASRSSAGTSTATACPTLAPPRPRRRPRSPRAPTPCLSTHRGAPLAIRSLIERSRDHQARDQHQQKRGRDRGPRRVPPQELADLVAGGGGAGADRLIPQVTLQVVGQRAGGFVPAPPVLVQRLHHHPVQFAPDDRETIPAENVH